MSASVKLLNLTKNCGGITGGIARIWAFDNSDFDFTQAAFSSTTGYGAYTAIALTTAGTTAVGKLLPWQFEYDQAEYTYTQTRKDGSSTSSYEHKIAFSAADISQGLANWSYFVDNASVCGNLGLIIQMNTGRFLVIGEASVNTNALDIPMRLQQSGTTGGTGKTFEDFSGINVVLTTKYKRMLMEYTGTLASLTALQ